MYRYIYIYIHSHTHMYTQWSSGKHKRCDKTQGPI